MLPADQRLGSLQLASDQAQLGLVKHRELTLVDGFAQVVFQLQTLQGAGLQAVGEELEIIPAQMLGVLHRHIRLADQCRNLPCVIRQQADAHRGADHQFMPLHIHRHAQFRQQPGRHPRQAR